MLQIWWSLQHFFGSAFSLKMVMLSFEQFFQNLQLLHKESIWKQKITPPPLFHKKDLPWEGKGWAHFCYKASIVILLRKFYNFYCFTFSILHFIQDCFGLHEIKIYLSSICHKSIKATTLKNSIDALLTWYIKKKYWNQ